MQVNACYTTDHEMEPSDDGEWVRYDEVTSALRGALAALEHEMRDWAGLRLEHGGYVKSFIVEWADRLARLRGEGRAPHDDEEKT